MALFIHSDSPFYASLSDRIKYFFKRWKEKCRFWWYSKLENGVVYIESNKTLDETLEQVRKGGYVICKPSHTETISTIS